MLVLEHIALAGVLEALDDFETVVDNHVGVLRDDVVNLFGVVQIGELGVRLVRGDDEIKLLVFQIVDYFVGQVLWYRLRVSFVDGQFLDRAFLV